MTSVRKLRDHQFKSANNFGWCAIHQSTTAAALHLLRLAVEQSVGGHRSVGWSDFTPSCIVLAHTAFDQWLTESCYIFFRHKYTGKSDDIAARFQAIECEISGIQVCERDELVLVKHLRDELVHWKPRAASDACAIPDWLQPLRGRGALPDECLDGKRGGLDSLLGYVSLAQWTLGVLADAADHLVHRVKGAGEHVEHLRPTDVGSFARYRAIGVPPPASGGENLRSSGPYWSSQRFGWMISPSWGFSGSGR